MNRFVLAIKCGLSRYVLSHLQWISKSFQSRRFIWSLKLTGLSLACLGILLWGTSLMVVTPARRFVVRDGLSLWHVNLKETWFSRRVQFDMLGRLTGSPSRDTVHLRAFQMLASGNPPPWVLDHIRKWDCVNPKRQSWHSVEVSCGMYLFAIIGCKTGTHNNLLASNGAQESDGVWRTSVDISWQNVMLTIGASGAVYIGLAVVLERAARCYRRFQGLCTNCGYPRIDVTTCRRCPECGAQLP
jgi:hypothetical protein